ncbi:MAG: hypothetical protein P8J50_16390 [Acidimicrobiales bacterium]|nr:hypothetical protein [Acidimicrobiales bacterium]
MKNHNKKLTQGILVVSGVVGGLAVATILVSFNGGRTDSAETSSAALADQSQDQQDTAAPEQPPTTVVVHVNEDGTVITDPESTGNTAGPSESEDVPADPESEDVPVYTEVPTDEEDDGPFVLVEVDTWIEDIAEITPWEPIDICELFPWLCGDDGLLVEELPEPCDPDEGTCPGWVIDEIIDEIIETIPEPCGPGGCPAWVVEDLIETIGGFGFEYSPVGLIDAIGMGGAQPPAIGGWMPIGF